MLQLVTCKQGGEQVLIRHEDEDRDPHARLDQAGCTHCADDGNADPDHHCGTAANACDGSHDGDCWNPGLPEPQVEDRPDGCTVCRPIHISILEV